MKAGVAQPQSVQILHTADIRCPLQGVVSQGQRLQPNGLTQQHNVCGLQRDQIACQIQAAQMRHITNGPGQLGQLTAIQAKHAQATEVDEQTADISIGHMAGDQC